MKLPQHKFKNIHLWNCFIFIIVLVIKKKGKVIYIRWIGRYPHCLLKTKNGNIVHFTHEKGLLNLGILTFGRIHIFDSSLIRNAKYIKIDLH